MTTEILRNRFEEFIEALVERIVQISDYFIVKKHISLSEGALFAFAGLRAVWFLFFGVANTTFDYVFGEVFWIACFCLLSAAHFVSFFFRDLTYRALVVFLYAVVWAFLMVIAAYSRTDAPAVPSFFVLTLLSVFIAVRLFREKTDA